MVLGDAVTKLQTFVWSPADICEQWERNLSFSSVDVCGAGARDEPLRKSAWEDSYKPPVLYF